MYDPSCSVYWCDKCGGEMAIDGPASTEDTLVLKCARAIITRHAREDHSCGHTRTFQAVRGVHDVSDLYEKEETDEPFWDKNLRADGRIEWDCPHGIGHGNHPHGCDGCCDRDDYPGKTKEANSEQG